MFHSLLLSSRKEKSALETDLRTLIKKAENVSELLRCTPVSRVFSAKGNKYWSRFTDAINASGCKGGDLGKIHSKSALASNFAPW